MKRGSTHNLFPRSEMTIESLKLEAQAALEALMQEGQLPFKLRAWEVVSHEPSQYTIRFYDGRLYSVTVHWTAGQSFKEIVRAAVLHQVSIMPDPLEFAE